MPPRPQAACLPARAALPARGRLHPPAAPALTLPRPCRAPARLHQVGPMQTVEVEVGGQRQMSGVQIERCRYLAESGCVAMCTNL